MIRIRIIDAIMEHIRNWLLPALVAVVQLAVWPGIGPVVDGGTGKADAGWQLAVASVLLVVATAALGVRRRLPVVSALAVEATLVVGLLMPADATIVYEAGVGIALFSVAVRCPARTTLLVAAVLCCSSVARSLQEGSAMDVVGGAISTLALFAVISGSGRERRRWHAGRRDAARELARAEAGRSAAAGTERHRLARELHDVSAHHLTSVVVTADTARRLGDRKPELTADALRFAADSGRETVDALHRLVAVMETSAADEGSALEDRVTELTAGFARLGQPVDVRIDEEFTGLRGAAAEALFGIVREALTNALRYAPGADVRVVVHARDAATLELLVEDDGTPAAAAEPGAGTRQRLGGGRGTTGMRERATALGGTLTAGPRTDGAGWAVRAQLPRFGPAATAARRRHVLNRGMSVDAAAVFAVAVTPFLVVLVEQPGTALAYAPTAAHALPLLWRRRSPWAVLWAVLALSWAAPVALAFGAFTGLLAGALAVGSAAAVCVALYTVAAYAGRAGRTLPALLLTAGVTGLTCTALGLLSEQSAPEEPHGFVSFLAVLLTLVLGVPLAAVWGWGALVHRRRARVRSREGSALAEAVQAAVVEAYQERQRIATELRSTVLGPARDVVTAAGRGDLEAVAERARAGLAAMRELLAALREVTGEDAENGNSDIRNSSTSSNRNSSTSSTSSTRNSRKSNEVIPSLSE
ncbi:histidine kinase [Streptomyces sp. NPDC050658]|uniref:histidine kinase n=1 Tax=unclassified Streptomyces TaxID=2593676 RepID=UPI00343BBA0F